MRDTRQERLRRAAETKVMAWIDGQPPGNAVKELCSKTDLAERTVRSVLKTLLGRGKIERKRVLKVVERPSRVSLEAIDLRGVREYRYYLRTRSTQEEHG